MCKSVKENPDKIYWRGLSYNPSNEAIDLLKANPDKIVYYELSRNNSSQAIKLLEANQDKINWYDLSANPVAIHLLEKNKDKIIWKELSKNPAIFTYDYDYLKAKMEILREDLCKTVFHPRNEGRLWCIEDDFF